MHPTVEQTFYMTTAADSVASSDQPHPRPEDFQQDQVRGFELSTGAALSSAARGERGLVGAVGGFEAQMRDYANIAVATSRRNARATATDRFLVAASIPRCPTRCRSTLPPLARA
jgi:hypothetical protein